MVCREGKYYISQSLNDDVYNFIESIDETTRNLQKALDFFLKTRMQLRVSIKQ
jgi:predicted RNase H-like HicB family nuclease